MVQNVTWDRQLQADAHHQHQLEGWLTAGLTTLASSTPTALLTVVDRAAVMMGEKASREPPALSSR